MDPETLKAIAAHLLLVSEVGMKYRCPACHGKPAVIRRQGPMSLTRLYVCGCGHEWDPPGRSGEFQLNRMFDTTTLLYLVVETGELPEVPQKIDRKS